MHEFDNQIERPDKALQQNLDPAIALAAAIDPSASRAAEPGRLGVIVEVGRL